MTEGIHDALEQQLTEVELLVSMFPGNHEFSLDQPQMLTEVQRFISGQREARPRQLAFTVRLSVMVEEKQEALELWCSLPHSYPTELQPEMFVKSAALSRQQQKLLNQQLQLYVDSLAPTGELRVTPAVMWLLENADKFLLASQQEQQAVNTSSPSSSSKSNSTTLSRLWIYSHHIYRKELLKKIPESAKELGLTGFVLPGKPGIICVEGMKQWCDEYWQKLKYPNWKHISCKHREDKDLDQDLDLEAQEHEFRLFEKFEELAFEAHGDYGLRNDYHMDLGQFREYLEDHRCSHVFQIFFGLEGKK